MKQALIIIDIQNDFCPGGPMAVHEGDMTVPVANRYAREFRARGECVLAVFHKGQDVDVDSYSAFFDNGHRRKTELDSWLQARGITHLVMLGIATDYCVKYSVLDALELGYQVTVVKEGCRGVNLSPEDSDIAFAQMKAQGAVLI